MFTSDLVAGIELTKTFTITDDQTAIKQCSGNLNVFATPSMIACMENTAMILIGKFLDKGFDSVGTEINVKHIKASLPGEKISVRSSVIHIENRSIALSIEATNEKGETIGTATHTRFIIDSEKFMKKLTNT